MNKYIIEIEDEPFGRNDDPNIPHGMDVLYRAKGFNSLVFDQFGLDKLTPLDEALEEAYQKGVHEGSLYVKQRVDGAYQKGYEVGQHEATTIEYQKGLDDAWSAAKKICTNWTISDKSLEDIFGDGKDIDTIMHENTASEAIAKIGEYEARQKPDEIKVGDGVTLKSNDSNWVGVVVGVDDTYAMVMSRDGYTAMYSFEILKKTDKHFPQVAELLKAMKEGAE